MMTIFWTYQTNQDDEISPEMFHKNFNVVGGYNFSTDTTHLSGSITESGEYSVTTENAKIKLTYNTTAEKWDESKCVKPMKIVLVAQFKTILGRVWKITLFGGK
jgi:hypothetical protein